MATYYHPQAKPSNPGADVDVRGAGYNGVRLECIELEVTAAQLAINNTFNFARYNSDTVILGGWVEFDELDSHATATLDIDIGLKDGTTTDADALLNGGVITGGGPAKAVLTAGVGTAVVTNLAMVADYTVYATVIAAPATAAAGTIKLCLLLGDKASVNAAAVS
jgi:hypothetical protein